MAPKPIITPGPTPQGPSGWQERQKERLASDDTSYVNDPHSTTQDAEHAAHSSTEHDGAIDKLKDKIHKVGEKLAFVPPKGAEAGAATQNASTMPE